MAEKDYTTFIPINRNGSNILGAIGVQWAGLANGDTGKPYVAPHRADKSVQVKGTFGTGGNVKIEGTNDQAYDVNQAAASPTYATLNDSAGNSLDIGAASIKNILENTNAVRPNVSAGDVNTNVTVTLIISSTARL